MLQVAVNRRHLVVFTAVIAVLVLVGWVVMSDRASAVTSQFDDVPDSNVFVSDINWLADAGVTRGCNPPSNTKYCPSDYVTREQMAAFMHRFSNVVAGTDPAVLARLDALEAENRKLKALLAGVSRDGSTLLFSGMNLQVVNGEGTTTTSNGVGNVIIGYNEPPSSAVSGHRDGSHYLVVGRSGSYMSYGGIVAGNSNTASGPFASVTGGYDNTASKVYASVTGGLSNTASGIYASVLGGVSNTASGDLASVAGGNTNIADGRESSICGGEWNEAVGDQSTISGGKYNDATGQYSSVSGGEGNDASGDYSSVLGDQNITQAAEHGIYPP